MSVRCVVFDLDDTLILERDYVRSGLQAVGSWLEEVHGVRGFAPVAWASFEAGVRGRTFDVALARLGIEVTPALIAELVSLYRSHGPDIALLPDAAAILDQVRARYATALVTDGPAASQRAKVGALRLGRHVEHIVVTDEHGQGYSKPQPLAFQLIERRTGCLGGTCVYIADNPEKDFAGPKRLGWSTVRVRRPGGLHASVPSGSDIDCEVEELTQIDLRSLG